MLPLHDTRTAKDLNQQMLQCLEPGTSYLCTTGCSPATHVYATPADGTPQPVSEGREHAPQALTLQQSDILPQYVCSSPSKASIMVPGVEVCSNPKPTHMHPTPPYPPPVRWLQSSILSTPSTTDSLDMPNSVSTRTDTAGDNTLLLAARQDRSLSLASRSAWESNPCFDEGAWETESGGKEGDGEQGGDGDLDEEAEGSLRSQDTPWEGSFNNTEIPLEQQMWRAAASADEQLQEVEKLQEQLLWYQQAVSDSHQRLAIADAGRLRLQAENQALQNCLQAADLDRCDLERSLDQAQDQRTLETKPTAENSACQSAGAVTNTESMDITLLRSENRALIDMLVGLKMETAMLRTADDELRHQLRASRATSAALMDVVERLSQKRQQPVTPNAKENTSPVSAAKKIPAGRHHSSSSSNSNNKGTSSRKNWII